jgi:probable HAF family extracellular repeat protein
VSNDGSVVVGYYKITLTNAEHAFIWDQAHGMRDLQLVLEQQGSSGELLQWSLQRATDVSADGNTLVGYGLDPQGRTQAFLARLGLPCYPNCDASTTPPALNVLDFNCFLNRFTAGDTYSNCDGSTEPPVLNVLDFNCFISRFTGGC